VSTTEEESLGVVLLCGGVLFSGEFEELLSVTVLESVEPSPWQQLEGLEEELSESGFTDELDVPGSVK